MRFLIVLLLVVLSVGALGLYRGWFHLASDSGSEKSTVTVTVDKDKIHQDKDDAQNKVQDLKQK
jgi:hypothetical protein